MKKQNTQDVLSVLEESQGARIYTPNPEILLLASAQPDFLALLQKAELLLCDGNGIPMMIAFKAKFQKKAIWLQLLCLPFYYLYFLFFSKKVKENYLSVTTGVDFMDALVAWGFKHKKTFYFLGAQNNVAKECAAIYKKSYKNLQVLGSSSSDPNEIIEQEILKVKPDILFVAYGAPKQEKFIDQLYEKGLQSSIMIGVGGSFDFKTGRAKRAPKWMRQLGLEWLWRLCMNPKQRMLRIFKAFIAFPVKTIFFVDSVYLPPSE